MSLNICVFSKLDSKNFKFPCGETKYKAQAILSVLFFASRAAQVVSYMWVYVVGVRRKCTPPAGSNLPKFSKNTQMPIQIWGWTTWKQFLILGTTSGTLVNSSRCFWTHQSLAALELSDPHN